MQALIAWRRAEEFGCVRLHTREAGRSLYAKLEFGATNEMRLDF